MTREMQIKIELKSIFFSFQTDRCQKVWDTVLARVQLEKGIGVEETAEAETEAGKSRVGKLEQNWVSGPKHVDNSKEWRQQTHTGEKMGKLDIRSQNSAFIMVEANSPEVS